LAEFEESSGREIYQGYSYTWVAAAVNFPDITGESKVFGSTIRATSSATINTRWRSHQAPTLPSPDNFVDIDPAKKDIFETNPASLSIFSGDRMN
jgi:hypothetical protein